MPATQRRTSENVSGLPPRHLGETLAAYVSPTWVFYLGNLPNVESKSSCYILCICWEVVNLHALPGLILPTVKLETEAKSLAGHTPLNDRVWSQSQAALLLSRCTCCLSPARKQPAEKAWCSADSVREHPLLRTANEDSTCPRHGF